MEILLPHPEKKRALLVVDMQAGFITEHSRHVIPAIRAVITQGNYSLVVEATFSAEPGSVWDTQTGFVFAKEPVIPEIRDVLGPDTIKVEKNTKSVFKGNTDVIGILHRTDIEEVHVVGIDAHDCVLSTAEESFDYGFTTYVIEECIASSEGKEYCEAAIKILREVEMTNHSPRIRSFKKIHS
ncbi:MAG: hydrolase [Parcubacteria group bacterium]|nr:hydrolase [Parcubacteria group bacterium]